MRYKGIRKKDIKIISELHHMEAQQMQKTIVFMNEKKSLVKGEFDYNINYSKLPIIQFKEVVELRKIKNINDIDKLTAKRILEGLKIIDTYMNRFVSFKFIEEYYFIPYIIFKLKRLTKSKKQFKTLINIKAKKPNFIISKRHKVACMNK